VTTKITVERISAQTLRVTLVADIQISGNLNPFTHREDVQRTADPAAASVAPAAEASADDCELLTIEETAEILHIGRDKVFYLIRTGQLRSIKIGKLRRISRAWIGEFVQQLETGSLRAPGG
jgi:excisionase family DNA binding protein